MSLYSNLFAYRPRPKRSPFEDFLSAALTDLLARLPLDEHEQFVKEVLLPPGSREAWVAWRATMPDAALTWVTQFRVFNGKGVVDLLLLVNGLPAVAVENKVGAPVRMHTSDLEGSSKELSNGNQLRTYGNWLAQECAPHSLPGSFLPAWPGALVLLTHASPAPDDYEAGNYGVPHVGLCRWRQIWLWARMTNKTAETPPMWVMLARELAVFLERNGMTADYMTLNDVAQAQVFVSAADRLNSTFWAFQNNLKKTKAELGSGEFYGPSYDTKGAVVWDWFYLKESPGAKWCVTWGIRFPETSTYWNNGVPALPKVSHAFVLLTSFGERVKVPNIVEAIGTCPLGWSVTDGNILIASKPLHEFPTEPESLTGALSEWISMRIDELRLSIPALVKSALGKR